jgi:hypothetical protein
MCLRAEALGGRLVAWSGALLALAWDSDALEDAVLLAASIREESLSSERAWSGGIAEGELEPLGPDGQHVHLAWGRALLSATSLARVARPGEVVIDSHVAALGSGRLSVVDERGMAEGGEQLKGWRLDLEHPWRAARGAVAEKPAPRREGALAERIRKLARGDEATAAVDALAKLRRARARAEGGPPAVRCQAALALGMMLSIAGRPEEALLEALDALARAKEAQDPKAVGACMALLAKLYAGAGLSDAASALRDGAGL